MRVVSTEKAFALVFEDAKDIESMKAELDSMTSRLEQGVENLPLSFVIEDESAGDEDRNKIAEEIMKLSEPKAPGSN